MFKEFNQDGHLDFLLFEFHTYFDGLLGINILNKIRSNIDLENKILRVKGKEIKLKFKPNFSSDKYTIPAQSKKIVYIPVDIEEGDIYINSTIVNKHFHITEGITKP